MIKCIEMDDTLKIARVLGKKLENKVETAIKNLNIFDTVLNENELTKQLGKELYGIDHYLQIQNMVITIQDKWKNTSPNISDIDHFINATEILKNKLNCNLLCALFISKIEMTKNGNDKLKWINDKYTHNIYISLFDKNMDILVDKVIKIIKTTLGFNGIKINGIHQNRIKLRDDQLYDINKFKEKLLDPNGIKTGIITKPTGTGKTVVAGGCLMAFYEKYKISALWITEKKEVLESQFSNMNKIKSYIDSGLLPKFEECHYIFWYNNKSNIEDLNKKLKSDKPVLLITNNASLLYHKKYEEITKDKFGMIIVDECHCIGGELRYDFAKYAINNWKNLKIILGFSATPLSYKKDNIDRIIQIFGDGKHAYFISVMTQLEAFEKDIIKPSDYYWIEMTLDKNISYNDFKEGLNKTVYEKLLKDIDAILNNSKTKKGIMWGSCISNIEEWLQIFNEAKNDKDKYPNIQQYKFISTHSKSKENNIALFSKYNNPIILLAVEQAKEGFDDPKIDLVGRLMPVKNRSPNKEQQQNGRSDRLYNDQINNITKEKAIIFDCINYEKGEDKIKNIVDMICYNILIINHIEALDPSYDPTKAYDKILKMLKFENGKVKLVYKEGVETVFNLYNVLNTELKHIDWKDIPIKIKEELKDKIYIDGINCRKAMEIIKNYKIETKERYYEICNEDPRLPKDPDSIYHDFPGWIEYLQIDRYQYYNIDQCISVINKIKIIFHDEIKEMNDNLDQIYNFCKLQDNKIPPLPCDFYKMHDIKNMKNLIFDRCKKKSIKLI